MPAYCLGHAEVLAAWKDYVSALVFNNSHYFLICRVFADAKFLLFLIINNKP